MAATGPGEPHGLGIRTRLAIVVVVLVALTAIVLGVGASAFVDASLRDQTRADALRQADYDLGVLIPTALPGGIERASRPTAGPLGDFRLRGHVRPAVHANCLRRRVADGEGNP